VVGCGPDAKDKRITELTGENERLRADLNDRDGRINELSSRDEDAQKALRDLNRELADLRDRLAKAHASAAESPEGRWIGMPGFDMISISGEVLFDSGKATLRPAGRTTLERIASDIRARYADRDIYVFGHTDDEPIKKSGWKDNWQLGAERALTATRYLIRSGIPPAKVIQANCGEFRPRSPGSSVSARKQNRRVEFYAVQKHSGSTEELSAEPSAEFGSPRTANPPEP
jgi:chemotaxis protein MotB